MRVRIKFFPAESGYSAFYCSTSKDCKRLAELKRQNEELRKERDALKSKLERVRALAGQFSADNRHE